MDERRQDGDAGDATLNKTSNSANDTNANGDAGDAKVAALDDGLKYTLTALEAIERFTTAKRKAPSLRSIQRYCDEGTILGTKIKTIYGQEWLINEQSLKKYIESLPIEVVVSGVASDASVATPPPPPEPSLNKASATAASGDAGDATDREVATPPRETRTLATVLIENAKILAQLEGKDQVLAERNVLVAELRDDRKFLREELTEARTTRGDVKEIAQEMLRTLKAVALRGLLEEGKNPPPAAAEIINKEGESRPA